MEIALRFFKEYETWIYLVLAGLAIWQFIKFAQAWEEMRGSAFSMEREGAQVRLNQAATILLLALIMAVSEFVLISFVAPAVPGAFPLPTPTLDLLSTPTLPLPPQLLPGAQETPTPAPTIQPLGSAGCVPGQVFLTAPQDGDSVSGVVSIEGSADIPNFGFYKYEIARPGEPIWLSINAGENPVQNGVLGEWVTSVLSPGDYLLRLVVTDNQGEALPPCVIQVRVQPDVAPAAP